MNKDTVKKLDEAIAACAEKAKDKHSTSHEALQFTQAALNAANAIACLENTARLNKNS